MVRRETRACPGSTRENIGKETCNALRHAFLQTRQAPEGMVYVCMLQNPKDKSKIQIVHVILH